MKTLWTIDEEDFIKKHYSVMPTDQIAKALGRTEYSIIDRATKTLKIFKTLKRSNRTYSLDVDYFKNLNSLEEFYWYGFLWADGSVYKNLFDLTLNAKDLSHIQLFKNAIDSSHPIAKDSRYDTYSLAFSSRDFVAALKSKNIGERKSYSSNIPIDMTKNQFLAFFLGLFDGDGSIMKRQLQIVSTPTMAKWLRNKILEIWGFNSFIYSTGTFAKRWSIHRKHQISNILDNCFALNIPRLNRKQDKYKSLYKI